MDEEIERCENCIYFTRHKDFENPFEGICRRNPPTPVMKDNGDLRHAWPKVSLDMWCGEHKRKQ